MLVGVVKVLKVVPGMLKISEKVKEVAVEQVPLRLYILLQVGVLKREVSRKGRSVVV